MLISIKSIKKNSHFEVAVVLLLHLYQIKSFKFQSLMPCETKQVGIFKANVLVFNPSKGSINASAGITALEINASLKIGSCLKC
jgi:hypothetical protein